MHEGVCHSHPGAQWSSTFKCNFMTFICVDSDHHAAFLWMMRLGMLQQGVLLPKPFHTSIKRPRQFPVTVKGVHGQEHDDISAGER